MRPHNSYRAHNRAWRMNGDRTSSTEDDMPKYEQWFKRGRGLRYPKPHQGTREKMRRLAKLFPDLTPFEAANAQSAPA